jgi:uncharacterized membrane protein YhdT
MLTAIRLESVTALSKDQGYGLVIFIISVIVAIVYLVAFFVPWIPGFEMYSGWHELAVGIPVLLFVLLVLVISSWIGWTMLTTPPPAPLEPEPARMTPSDDSEEPPKKNTVTKRKK